MLKNLIKKFIPGFLLSLYHLILAHTADFIFGQPSKKIVVIGVTGTNGKSTTVNLISKILSENGKTALSSTVNFKIGEREWLNNFKMTMPGRFFLQKLLSNAVKAGCKYAIIESSSEGILQHRHIGIRYDCLIFTNLTPEHIRAHGGFENYKNAKLQYFRAVEKLPPKIVSGIRIPKVIVANTDNEYAKEFLNFNVEQKIAFSKNDLSNLKNSENGIEFTYQNVNFRLNLKGIFDFYNALAAISTASAFGIDLLTAKRALEKIEGIPGRMELIDAGQKFKILVDYAPEPEGLKQLYATIKSWPAFAKVSACVKTSADKSAGKPHNKIIHLLGSTGGGRDIARRKILGQIAGKLADYVIVSNEDPYNDNPQKIIDDVAAGALDQGKILNQNLFKILNRRDGIAKALSLASENDLVLITGKGAEQKMAVKNGYIPWDDREVIREELKNLLDP